MRKITKSKEALAIQNIADALTNLGYDLTDFNYKDTPTRFVQHLTEYHQGTAAIDAIMEKSFDFMHKVSGYAGMLVQKQIPFNTICPHHLLPVTGTCALGYIPNDRLIGLSKLARLVKAVGQSKPLMQETCTDLIADYMEQNLRPKGVIVVISATHGCMQGRGIRTPHTPTITSTVRGLFRDVPSARQEFFELCKSGT